MKPETLFVVATAISPATLHCSSPGDGELLLDLASSAVGCVVALHHHHLCATDQGAVERLVISQFEADHVADLDRPAGDRDVEHARTRSGDRLGADLLQQWDQRQ